MAALNNKHTGRNFVRNLLIAGIVISAGMAPQAALSQAAPPQNVVTRYLVSPLEGDATREVRMQSVTIPPGGSNAFHRHPGDQWALVQEGEVTFTIKGQPPRLLKAGDSVHIPRGVVHRNQNLTDKPSRSIEVVILDKDKPQTEQVPD
jgi:quercetin dioxygenase-like cupin family protein